MNDNVKNFIEEAEANEELRAKIEALEGADDVIEQVIAIAAEYGYTLTEEDLETVTEEDLKEGEDTGLSLDDLDSVAGGVPEFVRELNWKRHTLLRWAVRMTGKRPYSNA